MFLKNELRQVFCSVHSVLAVFSLILQFYLNRQFVESQLVQVTKQKLLLMDGSNGIRASKDRTPTGNSIKES